VLRGRRWEWTPSPAGAGLGLAVAFLSLAIGAAPASARAIKRPDLIVTQAEVTSKTHVFLADEDAPVEFKAETKNIGDKPSPPTKTRLLFSRNPKHLVGKGGPSVNVPKLARGESDRANRSVPGGAAGLPMGSYYVVICADEPNKIVERDEDNNCIDTHQRLDVIAERWDGSVTGSRPLGYGGTDRESWSAPNGVVFKYDHPGAPGIYAYAAASGTLDYKVSGQTEQPGIACTYSGIGQYDVAGTANLYVDYRSDEPTVGTYRGLGYGSATYNYDATCTTPDGTFTTQYPGGGREWFNTGTQPQRYVFDRPPTLSDSYRDVLTDPSRPVTWNWDLEGIG
jgi:CARDB protein